MEIEILFIINGESEIIVLEVFMEVIKKVINIMKKNMKI